MGSQSDLDRWIEQLKRCEPLVECDVKTLCGWAQDLLVEEGNVQRVDSPVTICGCCFFTPKTRTGNQGLSTGYDCLKGEGILYWLGEGMVRCLEWDLGWMIGIVC